MADVKWVKITTDMFDNRKIKRIRKLPEGNNIILIWVMLLSLAGKCNASGMIFLTENIPYTEKMLGDELGFEESVIKVALTALESFGMICRDGDQLFISNWEEYQNVDGMDKIREQTRKRVANYRSRKKQELLQENPTDCDSNVTVTRDNAIDIEEDIDNNICSSTSEEHVQTDTRKEDFEKIYAIYPKKRGKSRAYQLYCQWLKGRMINGERVKLTNRQMYIGVRNYVRQQEQEQPDQQYWKNFDTLMGQSLLDYLEEERQTDE